MDDRRKTMHCPTGAAAANEERSTRLQVLKDIAREYVAARNLFDSDATQPS